MPYYDGVVKRIEIDVGVKTRRYKARQDVNEIYMYIRTHLAISGFK